MTCKVLVEDFQVVPALTSMRLPRDEMRDIFERALGQRMNVNSDDPVTAYGYETWRWTIRFLRESPLLRELGWVTCRHGQIEGIRHDVAKIKLIAMNTDSFTGVPSKVPHNVAAKGPSLGRHIKSNSAQLPFAFFESEAPHPVEKYDLFVFCAHAGDSYVSAEISRPTALSGTVISDYSTRIMICQPGEFDGFRKILPVPEEFAKVDPPVVRRKEG